MSDAKIKNMEEFAALSGISRPTVSKYFHDPDSVRASTRDRIEAALARYDYQPNIFAINQNRRLTKNVGIMVPYLADPFFAEIARNIENLVIEAGFRPILLSSHGDADQEIENLDSLRALKPAGVLIAPLGRSSRRADVEAFCKDVPSVHFDSNIEGLGDAFLGHDNRQATETIVDYLVGSGEPPVFFEMRKPTNPNAIKRRDAYVAAMEKRGLTPELIQVAGDGWDFEEIGYQGAKAAISGRQLTTNTVLCSNDRLAIGFLSAAYELGQRVGRGAGCAMRVAGHDNHPFAGYTCPTLTTVAQDYGAIAEAAVETLLANIESQTRNESRVTTLFPGKLIVRESA